MIVPQFWAECRLQHEEPSRQFTVKRFGWSDKDQGDAQQMADARAADALKRLLAGEAVIRREPKRAYNGAEGVPIREEIVSRQNDTIITRNSYGALCLNTPHALFIDIDYDSRPRGGVIFLVFYVFVATAFVALFYSQPLAWTSLIAGALLSYPIAAAVSQVWVRLHGGLETLYLTRIEQFVKERPSWRFAVYRTPAGMRLLALHRLFEPNEPDVQEAFQVLKADPVYVRMCSRQNCFRARVSPKPWRIGMTEHIRPRPGVWPIRAELQAVRQSWVESYEHASDQFAACRYLQSIGVSPIHPVALEVQTLHDQLCQAHTELPLA